MQDMDYGIGTEKMENAVAEYGNNGDGLFQPDHHDGKNSAEEGGAQYASQPSEFSSKRRRKKEGEEAQAVYDTEQPDDNATEPDDTNDEEAGFDQSGGIPPPSADEVTASPRRRKRGLDSYGRIIYDRGDSGQHDLSILTAARNARRILTASIDGIETDGNSLPRVVFYVGTVKVLIPFSEMGIDLNSKEVDPGEARRIIDSMLGAKIDYMVRGVNAQNRLVGASRRAAMLLRRQTILNARQGNHYRIKVGTIATARILQVTRNMMLVEVYGYQTYIRRSAASNLWVNDVREFAEVGEEKPVEVVELERNPKTGEVTHLAVSIRGIGEDWRIELRAGNTYTGRITGFSDTAYFVRVAGVPLDVRCPIISNNVMDMMGVGDFVKFVVRGVHDDRPTGSIRKIIKKAAAVAW